MTRRHEDDDDLFDENGLLKDKRSLRVPMMMRDSADDGLSDLQRSVCDHYAPLHVVDAFGNSGLALQRPGARYLAAGEGTVDHATILAQERNRTEARDDYIRETSDAWRNPPVIRDAQEGDVCTVRSGASRGWIEGSPGHLKMINGKLECVPDELQDGMDARDAAYDAMVAELTSAWKGGGG
jgi:hypothetical protein